VTVPADTVAPGVATVVRTGPGVVTVTRGTVTVGVGGGGGVGTETLGVGTEGAGTEGAGTEGAGTDGAGTDGAGTDGAGTEGAGSDGAGTEGAGTEGAGTDGAGNDGVETLGSCAAAVPPSTSALTRPATPTSANEEATTAPRSNDPPRRLCRIDVPTTSFNVLRVERVTRPVFYAASSASFTS
jgi:hypothetical protein